MFFLMLQVSGYKHILMQVFSFESCKTFKNNYFVKHFFISIWKIPNLWYLL